MINSGANNKLREGLSFPFGISLNTELLVLGLRLGDWILLILGNWRASNPRLEPKKTGSSEL